MKNILYFIFFIIVLAIGLIFTIYNSENVPFNYIVNTVNLPLSLVIIIAMILGVTLGLLACFIIIIRLRSELAQTKKSLRKIEQ